MNSLVRFSMPGTGDYYTDRLRQVANQWTIGSIFIGTVSLSLLLFAVYKLLSHAELTQSIGVLFLSEILLVLIASPYLSCRALTQHYGEAPSDRPLVLSRIRPGDTLGVTAVSSQLPLISFVVLSASVFVLANKSYGDVSFTRLLSYHVVLVATVFSSALIGMLGWRIFYHEIHAVQFAYVISTLMIGGVFLLSPLNRYMGTLQVFDRFSMIPTFLLINPLIAVCQLLEIDIFRTPHLYELTPLPSYLYFYPKWYAVCSFQVLVGLCCFFLVSRLGLSKNFHDDKA